ncbi:hypothetical protein MKK68_02225 [Methylobacterium sp. E-016]|uniref:hypothetical protein n=1 Tax=Methylobacterium sp. E-016 TaxID=2836556 RepID=UPI001FBB00C9|nr:hypothetical protein [Methylobacterium sp. E-016]MCJ2074478.1 hypothetical protein [Methylobacterium sp. E-016]
MRLAWTLAVVAAIAWSGGATAQSLEETVLPLQRSGAQSMVRREGPDVVVVDGLNWEVRVTDPAACTVRITDRSRPAESRIRSDWGTGPVKPSPNLEALYKEIYLGRVIPGDINKVPQVISTRNGVVVEQIVDANWRLAGSPGDEVWCQFWPDGSKSCSDSLTVERISIARGLPDQDERTTRVDRALVHLYGDLCKGAAKRVPF